MDPGIDAHIMMTLFLILLSPTPKKQLNGMFYSQYVNTIVSLVIVVFTTGIMVQEVMVSNYFPIDIVIKIPGNVSTIWNRNCRYLPQANTIILWDFNKNCLE